MNLQQADELDGSPEELAQERQAPRRAGPAVQNLTWRERNITQHTKCDPGPQNQSEVAGVYL